MRAGKTVLVAWVGLIVSGAVVTGCKSTVDSLGSGGDAGTPPLRPLTGPASYPNAFRDLLGKTDAEISQRINSAFTQLFHGEPQIEAFYFPSGNDAAYIRDTYHDDIRTEGLAVGMMVAVQLNQRTEFDRLWRYAKANHRVESGPNAGYYHSKCDVARGTTTCIDPYGLQVFTMALIFAHDRWVRPGGGTDGGTADGGTTAAIDYQAEAQTLLRVMRHKEADAGGVVDGVTNSFDAATQLVYDVPNQSAGMVTRPSIEMPAFYLLWGQATGDPFWGQAASAARMHLRKVAHPTTGLVPLRATFAGTPVPNGDTFVPETYRTHINMVLDRIWTGGDVWYVEESNRLLAFFVSKGLMTYGRTFTLDGDTIDPDHDPSLVVVNGAMASVATAAQAQSFVAEVWSEPTPVGPARYYTGILDLMALMILGGQYRVW
jgi:oligosaccharide reducing-end xylanase